MYGQHDIPLKISREGFLLYVARDDDRFMYRRQTGGEKIEKLILTDNFSLLINPIEPLNTPKELSHHLLIDFKNPVVVEPRGVKKIYIRFPVEIGVFISSRNGEKDFEVIDIFSLSRQKFTLYGDMRNGILCKYWMSDLFTSVPSINPSVEGVIELNITNRTGVWAEVTKAVFDAHHMKIYYSDAIVGMSVSMVITGADVAEIDFVEMPIEKGMSKSLELYVSKRLPVLTTRFVMEWGL